jgi:hypothetical protein
MTNSQRLEHIGSGPAAAHARQPKEQKSQSRKEGNIVRQGENLGAFSWSALWLSFPMRRV